jgi:hypothetical protein
MEESTSCQHQAQQKRENLAQSTQTAQKDESGICFKIVRVKKLVHYTEH